MANVGPSLTLDLQVARRSLDLDARLRSVPASAEVRGVWFRMHADAVARLGAPAVETWRKAAHPRSRWFFRMYDVRSYLEELAVTGAIIDPSDPGRGIRAIWRGATSQAPIFHVTSYLEMMLRPEPIAALRWLERHRDIFCSYGKWHFEERSPGHVVMHFFDEYIWIDTAHRGGVEGFLDACGIDGQVEPDLDSTFNGRLHVTWKPRR